MALETLSPRACTLACAVFAASPLFGCGSSKGAGFGADDGGSTGPAGEADAADDSSANLTFPDSGSSGLVFTSQDASPQTVNFPCQPGTYSGPFSTTVTTDAGLFPSLLSFAWNGTLSITLQGHVVQTMSSNGEDFAPAPVLTIAPGAMLSGTDSFGGHFSAGLAGQLDCPSKTLTGTLSNGVYTYNGTNLTMVGSLTGVYVPTGDVGDAGCAPATSAHPGLTGAIAVSSTSAGFSSLGANGAWCADHQ
jgi:hypothetical protein